MKKGLKATPFVAELRREPAQRSGRLIVGYIGNEAQKGFTRVFVDPELRAWLDIPDDDIEHFEAPPNERPNEPTQLWVRADADVKLETAPIAFDAVGGFLAGSIVDELIDPDLFGRRPWPRPPWPTGIRCQPRWPGPIP